MHGQFFIAVCWIIRLCHSYSPVGVGNLVHVINTVGDDNFMPKSEAIKMVIDKIVPNLKKVYAPTFILYKYLFTIRLLAASRTNDI